MKKRETRDGKPAAASQGISQFGSAVVIQGM